MKSTGQAGKKEAEYKMEKKQIRTHKDRPEAVLGSCHLQPYIEHFARHTDRLREGVKHIPDPVVGEAEGGSRGAVLAVSGYHLTAVT